MSNSELTQSRHLPCLSPKITVHKYICSYSHFSDENIEAQKDCMTWPSHSPDLWSVLSFSYVIFFYLRACACSAIAWDLPCSDDQRASSDSFTDHFQAAVERKINTILWLWVEQQARCGIISGHGAWSPRSNLPGGMTDDFIAPKIFSLSFS